MSARILAIDAGNTRIKWGLHDGTEWLSRDAVATAEIAGSHAFRHVLKASAIDRIVISNVAGEAVGQTLKAQIQYLNKPVTFITAQAHQCGIVNCYNDPAQLGSDRWAALIGARAGVESAPCAQLVVMSGTALTVDAIAADGQFLGGIIVPGLMLMHSALNRGTAQLPLSQGQYQRFPTSTGNAITSGAVHACAGAIARLFTHLSTYAGEVPQCIGSGGAMHVLAAHLPFPLLINDNLVLDGLIIIGNAGAANQICSS